MSGRARLRWVGLGFAILFSVFATYAIVGFFIEHHGFTGWTNLTSFGLSILLFMVVVGVVMFAFLPRADDYIEVDQRGLTLGRARRRWIESWEDPRLSVRVERIPAGFRRGVFCPPCIAIRGRTFGWHYITPEADAEILERARGAGLVISNTTPLWEGGSSVLIGRP